MRHGMTLGELARLARSRSRIEGSLTVVPVAGWRRAMALDETGLAFIPPSPNLRSLESLFHYPGLCLFEGTNLSVGRGSDAPFEQIGAPWLDTTRGARGRCTRPGCRACDSARRQFTPSRPGDGKYADTLVAGIRLTVTDRRHVRSDRAPAVYLLAAVRALGANGSRGFRHSSIGWRADRGSRGHRGGSEPDAIVRSWAPDSAIPRRAGGTPCTGRSTKAPARSVGSVRSAAPFRLP